MTQRKALAFERSSGNVFAELGLEHPEGGLAKAELIRQIVTLLQAGGLIQTAAARLLGLPQPKVSVLYRARSPGSRPTGASGS
jgi:predicted XRE-type DNA-binding protein